MLFIPNKIVLLFGKNTIPHTVSGIISIFYVDYAKIILLFDVIRYFRLSIQKSLIMFVLSFFLLRMDLNPHFQFITKRISTYKYL
jgi:hypothetical protein